MTFIKSLFARTNLFGSRKASRSFAVLAVLAVTAGLLIIPQASDRAQSVECPNPPTNATLNPYPVQWYPGGALCKDFPAIVGRNVTRGQHYPTSQAEQNSGVTATSGEEIDVQMYLHNGAANNLPQDQTDATNVRITTSTPTSVGSNHTISVSMVGTRANGNPTNTVSGSFTVHTGANERLEIVPNSGERYDSSNNLEQSGFSMGNNTVTVNRLRACFEYAKFFRYTVRVVSDAGQLNLTKDVRNVTQNDTSFADTTNANTNDVVEYRINVSATNGNLTNVTLRDVGVSGIAFIPGTLRVNGGLGSGTLNPAISLGNINSGQTDIINYQARVTAGAGTYVNTATATSGSLTDSDTATVIVSQVVNPVVCNPSTQTVNVNQNANFTATGGNGTFSWQASGGTPANGSGSSFSTRYTTSGTKTVTVTSNGQSDSCAVIVNQIVNPVVCNPSTQTVNVNQNANFTATGGNGTFSWQASGGSPSAGNGSSFSTSYNTSGTKTVTVTSNGQSDSCAVIVNQIVNPVVCNPSSQTVDINQNANFTATGGNGTFSWQASGGTPANGSGSSFSTRYTTSGTKTVTVTSNGQSDSCSVIVRDIPQVFCSPSSQTVDLNENAFLSATGGNGTFSWQASGGTPSTGSGSTFQTSYPVSGTKNVTVTSGTRTANCTVIVRQPQINSVVCNPLSQTVNIGQPANFTATGGNGTFSWQASGGSPSTGSGSSFSTSYNASGSRTVTVTSGNTSDSCQVLINQNQGYLSIDKSVRNFTNSGNFSSSIEVENNTTVEYRILVTANGGNVNNVRLLENLPSQLTLVSGSVRLDNTTISDNFSNSSISLGTMTSGQTRTLTFRAVARAISGQSQTVINNTAIASGDNTPSVSDSATVTIRQLIGTCCKQLAITKQVRNVTTGTSFQNSVQAANADRVSYEVIVSNVGTETVFNVQLTDALPGLLSLDNSSIRVDGNQFPTGNNLINLSLGTLNVGQQKRITYEVTVNATATSVIQNIARATGDGVSQVQDDAFVYVNSGNTNVTLSKKAWNDTKNVNAQSTHADRENYITYTLMVTNSNSTAVNNFIITDDLSGVLPLADMVELGGGFLSGNVISYPAITIPANGSVTKTFKVRVKYHLNTTQSFTMVNTYGNTVTINIPGNTPFEAPKTGASGTSAMVFGGLLSSGLMLWRKRREIMSLILA